MVEFDFSYESVFRFLRCGLTDIIFYLNCEQAQRYRIFLYSSIDPKDVAPMGIHAYSDLDELLKAAQLDGKSTYVIPNGSTVIPRVKGSNQ